MASLSPCVTVYRKQDSLPRLTMLHNSVCHCSGIQLGYISHRLTQSRSIIRCKANQRPRKSVSAKKKKENVWSLENQALDEHTNPTLKPKKKKKGVTQVAQKSRKKEERQFTPSTAIVTAAMPVETEKVLQTQEPVIKPEWKTFVGSVSGFWRGVGAAFSPFTAEMEPVSLGKRNEYLYDCYTLSKLEAIDLPSNGGHKKIHRRINWITANPLGEQCRGELTVQNELNEFRKKASDTQLSQDDTLEDVSLSSELMEEETIDLEPGFVFFEDGSYSRGPLTMEANSSAYYLSPTYQFEQCLVKGCHKRLRVVHTIALKEGGAEVELLRLAVYEEEWIGPSHLEYTSETAQSKLTPISQRKRISPPQLVGSWKVFEISATAILEEMEGESSSKRPSYVYLCMETLKKRELPEVPHFADEDALDMQDITVLWLPGGITAYVDTKNDGVLSVGIGWYSDDGINLVMERDYGSDGKLLEVRSKTEVKRRWSSDQF
eukprot:TRINITY_DN5214_c0_g1_i1.p1 TRINITY_DN5214_c0_g1~~TRINITY_DN5214_c0_g1_i1.p1  ORF type:complete len:490 (+),score=94.88 TRINITY_DN5214_c0_g1_i1:131-1600(+)